jgi:hypothetical protein
LLLIHHLTYTDEALNRLPAGDNRFNKQVHIGATVNDLGEFTNEANLFLPDKKTISGLMATKESILGSLVIYRSHFGDLARLHTMAIMRGEEPATTLAGIGKWFEYLNEIALGRPFNPTCPIADEVSPIQDFFQEQQTTLADFFDTDDKNDIQARATGAMLHLLQDSWTPSHCQRGLGGGIKAFYCYQLQNHDKHHAGDDVLAEEKQAMLDACVDCLKTLKNNQRFRWRTYFELDPNPRTADGGEFT